MINHITQVFHLLVLPKSKSNFKLLTGNPWMLSHPTLAFYGFLIPEKIELRVLTDPDFCESIFKVIPLREISLQSRPSFQ
jgi:hypothetical protein